MRVVIARLLAPAICFGLFMITCPLTAQSAAPAPEQPKCCSLAEQPAACAAAEHGEEDSSRCCVADGCGSVIAAPATPLLLPRIDAPRLALDFTASPADRAQRPAVPPPRTAPD